MIIFEAHAFEAHAEVCRQVSGLLILDPKLDEMLQHGYALKPDANGRPTCSGSLSPP